MSNQPSARTVNLVHFPGKDNDDPRALDEYLDQLQYAVTPAMYGGTKDDATVNNITAIEAAYAATKNVLLDGIYYVGDGGIELDAAGTIFAISPECGLKATSGLTETTGNGLVNITATGVNVLGILIDGDDAFRRGVRDTAGGAVVEGCTIENIYSTTASAAGIFANATAGGSIYRCNIIREVESVGNAPTTGDDNGASRGIQIFATAAVTQPYVIHDNDISRIIGEEGDGVQILCFSSGTFYTSGKSVISENRIRQCSKRAIKVQAHETTVRDNNIVMLTDLGADLFAGIDIIDSEDAIVDANRVHVTSTVRGISVTGTGTETSKRPIVSNNRVKTDTSTSERAIIVNEFEDCSVINNYVEYGYINITNGTKGRVADNTGNDLLASGTIGFVQTNTDANQITFESNVVLSGAIYAAVHVQSADNFIVGNKRMDGDTRCVFLSTATATGNIILNNVSYATTLDPVIYSTVDATDQSYVFGNVNRAGDGFSVWTDLGGTDVSTSQTSYDWTGLPSTVSQIIIQFRGTSTDGSSPYTLQIGDSGGIETTGYNSVVASGVATQNTNIGFRLTQTGQNASDVVYGTCVLYRMTDSTAWTCVSNISGPSNVYYISQGYKALTANLDRLRLTTANGTDVYDLGTVYVRYS